jgi:hypothetical protein
MMRSGGKYVMGRRERVPGGMRAIAIFFMVMRKDDI